MFAFLSWWAYGEEQACFPAWSTKKLLMVLSALTPGRSNSEQDSQHPVQLYFSYFQAVKFPQPLWVAFPLYLAAACGYHLLPFAEHPWELAHPSWKAWKPPASAVAVTGWSRASCADLGAVIRWGTASSARSEKPWPASSRSCMGKTASQMLKRKGYSTGAVMW